MAIDKILSIFGLNLPSYFNLKVKIRYLLRGIDEPDIRFIAVRFIRPGDCVMDVGANVGLTARAFARAAGNHGRVVAIEPERSNFSYLCANTLRHPCVEPHRLAFASNAEMRQLCLNPVSGTGNSFFGDHHGAVQRVQCLTFDEFCVREDIRKIDWIKIDVEGAELEVLGGMENSLKQNPHARLLIELCPDNLRRAGSSPEALLSRLRELGFRADVLAEHGHSYKIEACTDPCSYLKGRPYINLVCIRP